MAPYSPTSSLESMESMESMESLGEVLHHSIMSRYWFLRDRGALVINMEMVGVQRTWLMSGVEGEEGVEGVEGVLAMQESGGVMISALVFSV